MARLHSWRHHRPSTTPCQALPPQQPRVQEMAPQQTRACEDARTLLLLHCHVTTRREDGDRLVFLTRPDLQKRAKSLGIINNQSWARKNRKWNWSYPSLTKLNSGVTNLPTREPGDASRVRSSSAKLDAETPKLRCGRICSEMPAPQRQRPPKLKTEGQQKPTDKGQKRYLILLS